MMPKMPRTNWNQTGWCTLPPQFQILIDRYESTAVDRTTFLHVPSGTDCSEVHKLVEINTWDTIFKLVLINNMDNMRDSGIEPSSMILN